MKKIIAFTMLVAVASALPYDLYEDENGEQYYLVPLSRERRQTSVDIAKNGAGTQVTLGHQGNIFENDIHRLDGGVSASKQFRPSGPLSVGGNLGYTHVPSGSTLGVGASNTRGFGTDVGVSGSANLWQKGNSRLDATGSWGRHYGGPGGTGRPDYGVGLNFIHRF